MVHYKWVCRMELENAVLGDLWSRSDAAEVVSVWIEISPKQFTRMFNSFRA